MARAVDAVTTPTVAWAVERGVIGKRLCGSLGRRARTIVLATMLACTAMYWLFNPRSDNPLALSFGVLSSLFLVFSAMLGQAYTALGMELATRYDERTVLTGVESLFAFADCSAGVQDPSRKVCCSAACGLCGGRGCPGRACASCGCG